MDCRFRLPGDRHCADYRRRTRTPRRHTVLDKYPAKRLKQTGPWPPLADSWPARRWWRRWRPRAPRRVPSGSGALRSSCLAIPRTRTAAPASASTTRTPTSCAGGAPSGSSTARRAARSSGRTARCASTARRTAARRFQLRGDHPRPARPRHPRSALLHGRRSGSTSRRSRACPGFAHARHGRRLDLGRDALARRQAWSPFRDDRPGGLGLLARRGAGRRPTTRRPTRTATCGSCSTARPTARRWTAGPAIYGVSADTPLETELIFTPSGKRMLALVRIDGTDDELLGNTGRLRTKVCWATQAVRRASTARRS